jgi:hypothetical protein
MITSLQLEYAITDADLREAQSLHLRERFTGKSAWRAWAMQVGIAAGFSLLIYFRLRGQASPTTMALVMVFAIALLALFQFGNRSARKTEPVITGLEVSERELIFTTQNGRSVLLWSAFAQCLESPRLFVLLDRPHRALFVIPKRAFPDAVGPDWFRTLANQAHQAPSTIASVAAPAPLPAVAGGIPLRFELTLGDYVKRLLYSGRVKLVNALLLVVIIVASVQVLFRADAQPVRERLAPLALNISILAGLVMGVLLFVPLLWWVLERKQRVVQQLVISEAGIDFVTPEAGGLVAWNTYDRYLENGWGFILWNRHRGDWYGLPKRVFASPTELARCRELLRTHLKRSPWFWW